MFCRQVRAWVAALLVCLTLPVAGAYAQQTGSISGKVEATDGSLLPGVTVEARSPSLPSPRVTVTGSLGEFRLPALQPGDYTLTFVLSGMTTVTRQVRVQFGEDASVGATLGVGGVSETVQVTATATIVDKQTAEIKSELTSDQIRLVPVGQQYRDLMKLIPGVQYTQDTVRGPSAGGSGQDNVYQFDGVNVTLPLFGTLSAEPASYDIEQVSTVKGGARAVDFNRSGGFSIDSVSRSGTNKLAGQVSYQVQPSSLAAAPATTTASIYNQNNNWFTAGAGGPVVPNKVFIYGSYYRPQANRDNQANLYGALPKYQSTRNEGFGKLTATPISSTLFNLSYRDSHRLDTGSQFANSSASTTGSGAENWQRILSGDGSWVINGKSYVSFKFTHFTLETRGRPDNVSNATVNTAIGTKIDTNALDTLGLLSVPTPIAGNAAFNSFIQPLINRYGYSLNGVQTGGGTVGYGTLFDNDNFYRSSGQLAYNLTVGTTVSHEIHGGYQIYLDSEDLIRSSNGWGAISVPGGNICATSAGVSLSCSAAGAIPIYYQTAFQQQGTGLVPAIHSEYHSQSFEFNDAIRYKNLTINAGALISQDALFGQGLREDASTLSGYVLAPGNKYQEYLVPWKKMFQPRVGATWAYNKTDTIYASFAQYNPAASSLPRAASWDRNLATTINGNFDQNGVLFSVAPVASSSGKLFVQDMTPRTINEFMIGTAMQITPEWSARAYARYRSGSHFWEDTNNNARVIFNAPANIPQTLYIPDLAARTAQIGSGSSYVITELDGAYTKYYEGSFETDWRAKNAFVRASITYTRYYGNFDQDNSTTGSANDGNIFVGSSNIGDGAGRQLWNFRDGTLRGDRPYILKVYGYYALPWNATAGAFAVAQAGQPWETWSYTPYAALSTSTSDVAKYAEPAGSQRSPGHAQLDLNYSQSVKLGSKYTAQVVADLYNVFNAQDGYNYDPRAHQTTYGQPQSWYNPRVLQVSFRLRF